MSVLRFDPFRDFDRVADQLLAGSSGTRRVPRFMPMDLLKSKDKYLLLADLPGVDPASIDVDLDNGMLSIRAERSAPNDDSVEWLNSERATGSFLRQLTLGEGVDPEGITAAYENGVLAVTIPVAEKAKARKIEVSASKSEPASISTGD